jgi:glutamyl-tRNA synthetase
VNALGHAVVDFARSLHSNSRLRLAPTPSGYLHLGNAYNFILNWLVARLEPGAKLLLRIDDLDADRKRPEYVQDVFDTLQWLGLDWDEGPRSSSDFEAKWSQHLRMPIYAELLQELQHTDLIFTCAKSRRDLAPYLGKYPVKFRLQNLNLDAPEVAWRIKTPRSTQEDLPEDFIVRRRDGVPAYQLASLADDLYFGVTHLIRGEDLAASTAAQQFLATCLGRAQFANMQVLHHPLLEDAFGAKLSKSAGAAAIKTIREQESPAALYQEFAAWIDLSPGQASTANEILDLLRQFKIKSS